MDMLDYLHLNADTITGCGTWPLFVRTPWKGVGALRWNWDITHRVDVAIRPYLIHDESPYPYQDHSVILAGTGSRKRFKLANVRPGSSMTVTPITFEEYLLSRTVLPSEEEFEIYKKLSNYPHSFGNVRSMLPLRIGPS